MSLGREALEVTRKAQAMKEGLGIVITPNEDGFGTSSWVVGLAKELARQPSVAEVRVILSQEKWERFHHDKYGHDPKIRPIVLQGTPNRVQVQKQAGAVDVRATIEKGILTYSASRNAYAAALEQEHVLHDTDIVVDFGVPQMARAAYEQNLSRRLKEQRRIAGVTVFDHAWSLSLARIVSSDTARAVLPFPVPDALDDMRNDEALTQEAILFGEPICPLAYHGYWRRLLGRFPEVIPGVLGGPLRTLAYAGDPAFDELYAALAERSEPCPPEAYCQAKKYAKKEILGIEDSEPTLFVSGGGTPVWDDVLKTMFDSYAANPPPYNVVTYNRAEAKRRGVILEKKRVELGGVAWTFERGEWERCPKLLFIGALEGETHHVLFPAYDLVLTRAGGGTVNNAIAFRVPLVLVEERGMWQVEQIRQSCLRIGIARGIDLDAFIAQGRRCVESASGELATLDAQKCAMRRLPNHGEIWLRRTLLALAR